MSSEPVREPKCAKCILTLWYAKKYISIAVHRSEIRTRSSLTWSPKNISQSTFKKKIYKDYQV